MFVCFFKGAVKETGREKRPGREMLQLLPPAVTRLKLPDRERRHPPRWTEDMRHSADTWCYFAAQPHDEDIKRARADLRSRTKAISLPGSCRRCWCCWWCRYCHCRAGRVARSSARRTHSSTGKQPPKMRLLGKVGPDSHALNVPRALETKGNFSMREACKVDTSVRGKGGCHTNHMM